MKKAQVYVKYQELREKLIIYNDHYYKLDDPLTDDATYDNLVNQLKDIENRYPEFKTNTLTESIGSSLVGKLKERSHSNVMASLDNLFTEDDALKFDEKIRNFLSLDSDFVIKYSLEPKIDGVSLSIRYEEGKLVYALTRGDGYVGEDVTHSVLTIKDIPKQLIKDSPRILEVRGEVFFTRDDFLKLNETQHLNKQKIFANPRNAAAGSLRLLDSTIVAQRPLRFLAWGFGHIYNLSLDSFFDVLTMLRKLEFKINPLNRSCSDIHDAISYYKLIMQQRYQIPYDIDGVVYKVDSLSMQNRLGYTTKSPRWAAAYKFPAQEALTKIKSITVQVGRTGILTPVAELESVNIGGVVVSRASLHNQDELQKKDIREGDTVLVKRAGDIIPQIIKVFAEYRSAKVKLFDFPTHCPVCQSAVVKDDGGVAMRCSANMFFCKAQLIEGLKHFVSKDGFNIYGLAEKQLILFHKHNLLNLPSDIFYLEKHKDLIKSLDGMGELSSNNLFNAIRNSVNVPMQRFIYALGIKHVGSQTAKLLAANYMNIENFMAAFTNNQPNENKVANIDGIGSIVYKELINYFDSTQNIFLLNQLLDCVNVLPYQALRIKQSDISGKKIVFTGILKSLTRFEAKSLALKHGAIVLSAISKSVDILIIGEKAGSKLKRAQDLGITIMTEVQFLEITEPNKQKMI